MTIKNNSYKLSPQEKIKIRNTSDPIREELNKESLIMRFMEQEQTKSNKRDKNSINNQQFKARESKEQKNKKESKNKKK